MTDRGSSVRRAKEHDSKAWVDVALPYGRTHQEMGGWGGLKDHRLGHHPGLDDRHHAARSLRVVVGLRDSCRDRTESAHPPGSEGATSSVARPYRGQFRRRACSASRRSPAADHPDQPMGLVFDASARQIPPQRWVPRGSGNPSPSGTSASMWADSQSIPCDTFESRAIHWRRASSYAFGAASWAKAVPRRLSATLPLSPGMPERPRSSVAVESSSSSSSLPRVAGCRRAGRTVRLGRCGLRHNSR